MTNEISPLLPNEHKNTVERASFGKLADKSTYRQVKVVNEAGEEIPIIISGTVSENVRNNNAAIATADSEISKALTAGTKQFLIASRDPTATLRFSTISGETADNGNYTTIPKGTNLTIDAVNLSGATIYLRSDVANNTAEIIEWY